MPRYSITYWPGSAKCTGSRHQDCGHPERTIQAEFESWEHANHWSANRHIKVSDGALIKRVPTGPLQYYLAITHNPNRSQFHWIEAEDFLHVREILMVESTEMRTDYRTIAIALDHDETQELRDFLNGPKGEDLP